MESMLLRADEVAELLGLGRTKVFELIAAGELPLIRIGRSVRIPRWALEEWVRQRTSGGDPPPLQAPLTNRLGGGRWRPA